MAPHSPPIFFDPVFVRDVIVGWLLVLAGAALLFVAGAWWSYASDSAQVNPKSAAWRGLCIVGWAVFLLGWVWQLVGYVRFGLLQW
jgi:hypothetical protein